MDKVVIVDKHIEPGEVRCIQADKKPVAVWNVAGTYYAAEDFCPHLGGPLSEGTLEGTFVTCPWHAAKFDLTTGKPVSGPCKRDLVRYKVLRK